MSCEGEREDCQRLILNCFSIFLPQPGHLNSGFCSIQRSFWVMALPQPGHVMFTSTSMITVFIGPPQIRALERRLGKDTTPPARRKRTTRVLLSHAVRARLQHV